MNSKNNKIKKFILTLIICSNHFAFGQSKTDSICKDVINVKEIDSEKFYSTIRNEGIAFRMFKIKKTKIIYFSIKIYGPLIDAPIKGLTILLDNNVIIEKPNEKIDIHYGYDSNPEKLPNEFSSLVRLTENEVKLLLENKIVECRLNIYSREYFDSEKTKQYLHCLVE